MVVGVYDFVLDLLQILSVLIWFFYLFQRHLVLYIHLFRYIGLRFVKKVDF